MDQLQQQQIQQPEQQGKAVKLATPEQKKQLLDMIEQTRGKLGEFNAHSFAMDNKDQSENGQAMRQLFDILQSAGVDLTNPKSVSDFINNLRQQNPQMAQVFEQAVSVILGGGEEPQQEVQPQQMPQQPPLM